MGAIRQACLAAADIALNEAVHLATGVDVGTYLLDHSFLRACKVEGQTFAVEAVEHLADARQPVAYRHTLASLRPAQHVDLDVDQLVEFKSETGLSEIFGVSGVVYLCQCLVEWHQAVVGDDRSGQRIDDRVSRAEQS